MLDIYNGFLGPQDNLNRSDSDHDHFDDKDYNSAPVDLFALQGVSDFNARGDIDVFADGGNGIVFATGAGNTVFMEGDIAGDNSTTATVDVNGAVTSSLEVLGDADWFGVELQAGVSYTFFLIRSGDDALDDPFLYLYDANGALLTSNDDIQGEEGTVSRNSAITFTASADGTYYLGAEAFANESTGEYTLYANQGNFRPTVGLDTQADFLVNGFDNRASWNTNTITYDISALPAAEAALALIALELFAEVTPLNFVEATAGQTAGITFVNNEEGAFASTTTSNGSIISSTINISAVDWIEEYGTDFNSFSTQTYIHEVGHALGLGHGGPYNGTSEFGTDNIFANDLWQYTVQSYNDQGEGLGANAGTPRLVLGLQMVDIIAIQDLYGANETGTREGTTVYGFNASVGGAFDFASFQAQGIRPPSVTIYDTGGFDILDLRGYSSNQVISLLPGSFSSIGDNTNLSDGSPLINVLSIDRETIIEFAIGGSGDDNIIGNDVDNTLAGREGDDAILGMGGNDTIFTDAGNDVVSGGDGNDIILGDGGDDILNGDGGDDVLNGGIGDDNVNGNDGNDMLTGGAGNDSVNGGEGNDEVFGNFGNDTVSGNNGDDIVAGEEGDDIINGDAGNDLLRGDDGNDTINGDEGDDGLDGGLGDDILNGGAGNDAIFAQDGNDSILGGSGDDVLFGQNGNDTIIGAEDDDIIYGGEGTDVLLGGTGNDIVFGENGNDIVLGEGGNDRLEGGAGNDTIVGGTGVDTITTGLGSDIVIIGVAGSVDTVTDFDVTNDRLQVNSDGSFDSFAEIQAVTTQNGADTVITLTNGSTITLQGVTATSLSASNFTFLVESNAQEKLDDNTVLNVAFDDSFDFISDTSPASDDDSLSTNDFGGFENIAESDSDQLSPSISILDNVVSDGIQDTGADMFDSGMI